MALNAYQPQKLYYSIKEVAEMFGLNESTLRYWVPCATGRRSFPS